ncbi:hypothetical protein HZB02_04965 [Candidatus Woesearchaeota archaeon]|nr:hypothetical protein [Candidatus Woesearchaeota archaeon]
MDLLFLTSPLLLLLLGIVAWLLAREFKLPTIPFLLLAGIIAGKFTTLPSSLYAGIVTLGMVLLLIKPPLSKERKTNVGILFSLILLLFNIIGVGILFLFIAQENVAGLLITIPGILALATILTATDPCLGLLRKSTLSSLLLVEHLFLAPIAILLPVLAVLWINQPFLLFLQSIFVGIAIGILGGMILFRVFRKIQPTIAALLCFATAQFIGGDGVIAAASLWLFFGRMHQKNDLEEVAFLDVILVVSFGMMLPSLHVSDTIIAILVFVMLFGLRYLLMRYIFHTLHTPKEIMSFTLLGEKGVIVATGAGFLVAYNAMPTSLLTIVAVLMILSSIGRFCIERWQHDLSRTSGQY